MGRTALQDLGMRVGMEEERQCGHPSQECSLSYSRLRVCCVVSCGMNGGEARNEAYATHHAQQWDGCAMLRQTILPLHGGGSRELPVPCSG